VREMTSNFAGTRRPSRERRTAGVDSAKEVRGARREVLGWGRYGMGTNLITLDYENTSTDLRSYDFGPARMSIQCQQPVSPAHHSPVIFVSSSAERTYLIVAAIGIDARPTKLVRTTSAKNPLQEIHYFTPSLRLLQVSSQWLKNNLGRISSRCCSVDKSSFGG